MFMKENKKKEELQTRREFFKNAAKSALPIVAGVFLTTIPQVTNASTKIIMDCDLGCYGGCYRTCNNRCQGCQGGCNTNCAVSCDKTCKAICSDNCYKSCTGGNQAYKE